jgi:hypothetical protein
MTVIERREYTRVTYRCDNCGVEEHVVRLHSEPPDSPHQLPPVRGWMAIPILSFARNSYLACSRECADELTKKELDEIEGVR